MRACHLIKERKMGLLGLVLVVLIVPFLWTTRSVGVETAEKPRKVVALTFDDGPDARTTKRVLEILKEKRVRAAFFCIGEKIEENKSLLEQIYNEGHEIGNHTFTHCDLCCVSLSKQEAEVQKTTDIIQRVTGEETIWLRPPFGKIRKGRMGTDYLYVGWTVDTLDWCSKSSDAILLRVKKQLKEGGIILMHDQYESTLQALPQIIDWVQSQGYDFVSLEELFLGD